MVWDQVPLSWRDFLKFLLEGTSIAFAIAPIILYLETRTLDFVYVFPLVFIFLLSLLIMRIVEKEMYEVFGKMAKGKILKE